MVRKPGVLGWVLLAACAGFALLALHELRDLRASHLGRDTRSQDLAALFLCGVGALAALWRIVSGWRFARMRVETARVAVGVPIRPSRARALGVGVALLAIGAGELVFAQGLAPILRGAAWLLAGLGAATIAGVAAGWLPQGSLTFRADGLAVSVGRATVVFPWERIVRVEGGEFAGNPAVFLHVDDVDGVAVTPLLRRRALLRRVAHYRALCGADWLVLTAPYGVAAPVMVAAIEGHRADASAGGDPSLPASCQRFT